MEHPASCRLIAPSARTATGGRPTARTRSAVGWLSSLGRGEGRAEGARAWASFEFGLGLGLGFGLGFGFGLGLGFGLRLGLGLGLGLGLVLGLGSVHARRARGPCTFRRLVGAHRRPHTVARSS